MESAVLVIGESLESGVPLGRSQMRHAAPRDQRRSMTVGENR